MPLPFLWILETPLSAAALEPNSADLLRVLGFKNKLLLRFVFVYVRRTGNKRGSVKYSVAIHTVSASYVALIDTWDLYGMWGNDKGLWFDE